MTKHIFFPIFLIIIFIIVIGILGKNIQNRKIKLDINPENNKKTLTIKGKEIKVEIADTDEGRRIGLSDREKLEENTGMLFIFENKDIKPSFWMKNMKFPIDIIWIDNKKIIQIDENVSNPEINTPDSKLKLYTPKMPIDMVLEVNAGFVKKNNIKIGDKVDTSKAL